MERMASPAPFVIRALAGPGGNITGTVQRVRTGEKVRFARAEYIASLLARMMARGQDDHRPDEGTGGAG